MRVFTLTAVEPVLSRFGDAVCRHAADVGWRLAEGIATTEEVSACLAIMRSAWEGTRSCEFFELFRLMNVMSLLFNHPNEAARELVTPDWGGQPLPLLTPAEARVCCGLLRDIFGDRGYPVTCSPSLLTTDVTSLARGIYDERAFDRLPILADALQDAGCDNDDILDHCRGPGPHVRGCWVVDLVLGKN
jgi:hypothetical protein